MTAPFTDTRFGKAANAPFSSGVAAIAYDKKNNRLYYTPMLIDQLRYIDLKTMKVYFVNDSPTEALKVKNTDQSNIITRMVIADDGRGYALTNDGKHLIQFTTGKKIKTVNLGPLADDPANKTFSIHNSTTSFGGDMIADNDGNPYVFSAFQHVFKVNTTTRIARYLGKVSGLAANFTINGAAVTADNKILITSATQNTALYTVDIETLAASIIDTDMPWRSSDLANSNLLESRKRVPIPALLTPAQEVPDNRIGLYPNPVTANRFIVQFNQPEGKYTILVTDVLGRQTFQSIVTVNGKGQFEYLELPATTKKGIYLVKVVDQHSKSIFSRKIVIQ
jgi:hypothetical protein